MTVTSARVAGTLLVECGLVSSSQLAEALEHQRMHGGSLDEVVSKLFDLPLGDLRAAMAGDPSGIDVGAILFATNIVDEETLAEARERSRKTGQPVGPVLVEMGAVTRLELASALADQWSDSPAMILPSPTSRKNGTGADPTAEVDDLKFAMRQLEASMRAARVTDGSDASLVELADREAELAARVEALEAALAEPVEVDPAFLAEFQATVRRTHEIEAALAGLAPAEALAVFAAAAEEVRGLQGALDALAARVEQGLTVEALEPVVGQVAELAARVDGLADGAPVPTVEEIAALRGIVEEIAARPVADPAGADALAQRIEELASALPALDVRDELSGLRAQLDELTARPVVDEGLAARVDSLTGLVTELADRPTADPSLADRFQSLATQVEELAARPAGDPDVGDRLDELARAVDALSMLAEASSGAEGLQDALTSLAARIDESTAGTAGMEDTIAELRAQLEGLVASVEDRLAGTESLTTTVAELSGTLGELEARPAGDPELEGTVAGLAAQLAELEERPPGDPELAERVAQLAERVDGLAVDALGPAAAAAVADVTARLDALAESRAEDAERVEALRARIEEARAEIAGATESAFDSELGDRLEETRLALADLAARVELAATGDQLDQLRASIPEPGLDQVTAQRLTNVEESLLAIGAAAGDASAIEEIKARLDEVSQSAETRVAVVLERLVLLEEAGSSGPNPETVDELRKEIAALGAVVESVREAQAAELGKLESTWAAQRTALEDRLEALADGSLTVPIDGGAAPATAASGPEFKKLAREMERLQDRVVEQERSLVEHFARREKALSDKVTGGSDASRRLAELTQLVEEQRTRIDRLSSSGGGAAGGGGGASGDELTTLKESLFLKLEKLASSIDWRFQRLEGGAGGGSPAASAARTDLQAKVDELARVVEHLAAGSDVEMPTFEVPGPGDVYLALVPTSTGHQLVEMQGDLPDVGDVIASPTRKGELTIVAVGTSPLPGDERSCIFVEPVDAGARPKTRAKA